jgi:hypothetical protein
VTLLEALGIVWCIQMATILAILGIVCFVRWDQDRQAEREAKRRVDRMIARAQEYADAWSDS